MSFNWIGSAVVCSVMAFGCGGGKGGGPGPGSSGVDGNVSLLDITPAEAADVCEYLINLEEQPEREIDCGNGSTITVGTTPAEAAEGIADCTADLQVVNASCTATVGDIEDCFEALASLSDAELCSPDDGFPAVCDVVIPCLDN